MTTLSGPTTLGFGEDIDNRGDTPAGRAPLVLHDMSFGDVTEVVTRVSFQKPPIGWYIAFTIALCLLRMLGCTLAYLILTGIGVFGNNQPVGWGFPIVNFVFWVGIGHAGTLISAILFLLRQNWRTSINRFAEAMTIFAVMCAAMYPGIHVGRPWLAYWLAPVPNQMGMWPQFRSPLLWDVFAVGTYATVSLLFWYTGMVPDLATLRDRAPTKFRQFIYGVFALGWTGSNRHWHRFERAYLILAGLATPLVLSVHSVVSFDFAVSQLPGWHTTIFPPYFVGGAIFGGFAMVLTLAIPARQFFGLKDIITLRHLDNMGKVMLATGLIVSYSYAVEFFTAWYSGVFWEQFLFKNRVFGPYWWAYASMVWCNVIAPQFLWSKRIRENLWCLFIVANFANIGMWWERFVIIVTSLTRDFLPSSWGSFTPTWVDICMFAGTFGLFFTMFLLFCRFLPMIAMAEVKTVMPQAHAGHGHAHDHNDPAHHRGDFQPDEQGGNSAAKGTRF